MKTLRIASIAALAAGLVGGVLALRPGFYEGGERTTPLAEIEHYGDRNSWRAPLPEDALASPSIEVLEDGRPLGPAVDPVLDWRRIHERGEGAYGRSEMEDENDRILFSTRDNSSPLGNGRVYAVRYVPRAIDRRTLAWLALLLAALSALLAWTTRALALPVERRSEVLARARRLAASPSLLAAIVLAPALLARAPYWRLPNVFEDSAGYFELTDELAAGGAPDFAHRPPGYPVFLHAVFAAGGDLTTVVVVQSALALAAALFLVGCVRRVHGALALPAAIAVAAYLASPSPPLYEFSILSESLYVTGLLLVFGALLVAVHGGGARWGVLASSAVAAVILTRAAGFYLIVTLALAMAFLLRTRAGWRRVLGLALPLPLALLGMATYNARIRGEFTPNAAGESNLVGATGTFLTERDDFPPAVNEAIRRSRARLSPRDREVVERSWDPDRLWPIYLDDYNYAAHRTVAPAIREADLGPAESRRLLGEVAFHAIRTHPWLYAKFVWTNVHRSFTSYTVNPHFPPTYQLELHTRIFLDQRTLAAFRAHDTSPRTPSRLPATVEEAYRLLVHGHRLVAKSGVWIALWLVSFLTSLNRCLRSRGRDPAGAYLLLLTSAAIGAGLLTSLVELAIERYAYTWEFVFYLSPVLAAAALRRSR